MPILAGAGAALILRGDTVLGAVAVSGGMAPGQDDKCAEPGLLFSLPSAAPGHACGREQARIPRRRSAAGAFVVEYLLEHVDDSRQVRLVRHDLADVLVGARVLINKSPCGRGVPGLTFHRGAQPLGVEVALGLAARQ